MKTTLAISSLLLLPLAACAASGPTQPPPGAKAVPARSGGAPSHPTRDAEPRSVAELLRRHAAASGRELACDDYTLALLEGIELEPLGGYLGVEAAANSLRSLEDMELIELRHADAAALARVLNELLGTGSSRLNADVRTNSLLVRARPDQLEALRELVARLDRELPADPAGPPVEAR